MSTFTVAIKLTLSWIGQPHSIILINAHVHLYDLCFACVHVCPSMCATVQTHRTTVIEIAITASQGITWIIVSYS